MVLLVALLVIMSVSSWYTEGACLCIWHSSPQSSPSLNPLLSPSRTGLLPAAPQQPGAGTFLSVLTWMMRCVKGCVSTLRKLGACPPGWRLTAPRVSSLSLSNAAVALSSGNNTNTVSQLKMPCTAEPLKALQSYRAGWLSELPLLRPVQTQPGPSALTHLWNSSRSPDCAIETRVLVMEVPTLTPMMIGTDTWTVSTVGVPFQQPCLFTNPPATALGKGRCTHT